MKKKTWLQAVLIFCILLLIPPAAAAGQLPFAPAWNAAEANPAAQAKIAPDLAAELSSRAAPALVPVIITLKDQADLSAITLEDRDERLEAVVLALKNKARASQLPILTFLNTKAAEGAATLPVSLWIFNGVVVSVNSHAVQQLAARPDVLRISADQTLQAPEADSASEPVEENVALVNAPALWNLGFEGAGIVVASLDTGVSVSHPDLAAQYRGGSNSWFDPYRENTAPVDLNGHGTRTMGVIVGRSEGGSAIGVAPQAQWIAAKIFDNRGSGTTSAIHLSFQWLLDPDGDPSTPDAPHVVNNSWNFTSPGCSLEFQLDLQALRAAGILPVFAAGNAGPNPETSLSPANNPEAFAVGAVNNLGQVYPASSRGPTSCGGPTRVFPELSAPGVNILSSDRYGTYSFSSGTSLAAPHAAGGLALLLSAFPNLTAAEQEQALLNGAADLGEAGPDNTFGAGLLDLLAAYMVIADGGGQPTPTPLPPTPTSTPLPTPTLTPTPLPSPTPSPTPTSPPPTATPLPDTNLALGQPVQVSSVQDSSHSGAMAVDGSLDTSWQTRRVNKNKTTSEWIAVDLGSVSVLSQVVLKWDAYFATSYSLQTSPDGSSWTTRFTTALGDGQVDSIPLDAVEARYVRLNSTAWNDAYQRIWLKELEVFGLPGSSPVASPTPAAPLTMHIADLDGASVAGSNNRWNASVTIRAVTSDGAPAQNVTVSGAWSAGISGSGSCVTDSLGQCTISYTGIKTTTSSVAFSITGLAHSSWVYQPGDNTDPDGDSDGTTIVITRP